MSSAAEGKMARSKSKQKLKSMRLQIKHTKQVKALKEKVKELKKAKKSA
jgi:hypothetical protein